MRLNPTELSSITRTLQQIDPAGAVYLFGSRADDTKKGGDIDIYFETTRPIDARQKLALQYELISQCDCHVDLLIKHPSQPMQPIHAIARAGIRL